MNQPNDAGGGFARKRIQWETLASVASVLAGLVLLAASLVHGGGFLTWAARTKGVWALACLAGAALFMALPGLRRLRAFVRKTVFESNTSRFYPALFIVALTSCALTSLIVFHASPRIDDEVSALFQARIFAHGAITLPLPPHPEFYEEFCVLGAKANCGHWCTMYAPGWPLLLVSGVLAGLPWMVDPILGGFLVVMIAVLGVELFGLRAGRTAGLLALTSPFLTHMGATLMTHTATALLLVLFMWGMIRLLRTGRPVFGTIAGGAWGMAFLCRPFTALIVGVLIFLVVFVRPRRAWAARRGLGLALALALASAGMVAAWQYVTTGDPLKTGYWAEMGERDRLGFSDDFTPWQAREYTEHRVQVVNQQLLGWPIPALWLVLLPFLLGRARGKEAWLLAPLVGLLAGYAFYWYFEWEIPGRYIFEAMPMLLILAARGLGILDDVEIRVRRTVNPAASAVLLISGILFSLTAGYQAHFRRFGPDYYDMEDILPGLLKEFHVHKALVFIEGKGYFATGFMRNSLDLKGDIVFARDLGDSADLRLMAHYQGRRYYRYMYSKKLKDSFLSEIRATGTRIISVRLHQPAESGSGGRSVPRN
jgi:hypothetical protein